MWDQVRREFPVLSRLTYLNTASMGLMPRRVRDAVLRWLEERELGNIHWRKWYDVTRETAALAARFIGARQDEVSVIPGTSYGLNFVLLSVRWRSGDEIVTNDLEFPTVVFACEAVARRFGLKLRVARSSGGIVTLAEYRRVVSRRTRAIVVSWVEFSNGFRHNLAELSELAESVGALLIVDGIQGVGALSLNVSREGVHVLVTGAQKWLLGLPGAGIMYVRRDVLDELEVPFGGWLADERPFDLSFREFRPAPDCRRFELGTPSFVSVYALRAALEFIMSLGIEKIEARDLALARYLVERAEKRWRVCSPLRNGAPMSPIVSLRVPQPEEVVCRLRERGVIVSARGGCLRVSPHFYNTEEDIDRLISCLAECT